MGQLFRKKVAIRDLPRIELSKKTKSLDNHNINDNDIANLFQM